jgi:hypothetical protein
MAGMKPLGITPPTIFSTNSDELETATSFEGLDTKFDFAKLAGSTALFLVPVVTLRLPHDRFMVRNLRPLGFDVDALILDAFDHQVQVHLAQAMKDELVRFDVEARLERGVLLADTSEDFGYLVFVAPGLGHDGQGVQRSGIRQRLVVHMIEGVIVVEDIAQVQVFNLGNRAHVARNDSRHWSALLALHLKEVA